MVKPQKKAVIGADLGGTKLDISVFPLVNGRISETAVARISLPTERGPTALQNMMKRGYDEAVTAAPGYQIIGMGLGSPGRPVFDHKEGPDAFVVAPTSAENLERENRKGELHWVNLQAIFQDAVPVPLSVNNDAIVQMQAVLKDALGKEGKTDLYRKDVGYVGMGTGLGGGFGKVDKQGNISLHTDGHIYDVRLEMHQDLATLKEIDNRLVPEKKFKFDPMGNSIRAEDVLSGTAFTKLTGLEGETIKSAKKAEAVRPALEIMGRGLAELVAKIRSGGTAPFQDDSPILPQKVDVPVALRKLDPEADWSVKDSQKVKGTSRFLMGGGMANNPYLMNIIEETAQKALQAEGITDVKFISVPQKETTLAAANIIPQEVLQRSTALLAM